MSKKESKNKVDKLKIDSKIDGELTNNNLETLINDKLLQLTTEDLTSFAISACSKIGSLLNTSEAQNEEEALSFLYQGLMVAFEYYNSNEKDIYDLDLDDELPVMVNYSGNA